MALTTRLSRCTENLAYHTKLRWSARSYHVTLQLATAVLGATILFVGHGRERHVLLSSCYKVSLFQSVSMLDNACHDALTELVETNSCEYICRLPPHIIV